MELNDWIWVIRVAPYFWVGTPWLELVHPITNQFINHTELSISMSCWLYHVVCGLSVLPHFAGFNRKACFFFRLVNDVVRKLGTANYPTSNDYITRIVQTWIKLPYSPHMWQIEMPVLVAITLVFMGFINQLSLIHPWGATSCRVITTVMAQNTSYKYLWSHL